MRSNALYVAGPADQVREVEAMLRVLDASELPEQLRDRTPHRIQVQHAEVEDVAAIVKEIYKDDMTPKVNSPASSRTRSPCSWVAVAAVEAAAAVAVSNRLAASS